MEEFPAPSGGSGGLLAEARKRVVGTSVLSERRLATDNYLLLFWFKKVDCLAARIGLSYSE